MMIQGHAMSTGHYHNYVLSNNILLRTERILFLAGGVSLDLTSCLMSWTMTLLNNYLHNTMSVQMYKDSCAVAK
jgi:hypothetical protein